MKIISVFNNKGGVGKSTLGFHLGYALNELGLKTLMIDLDPQCNLTICGIETEELHKIWEAEDEFIEDFEKSFKINPDIINTPRSIHFLLKPTEDGISDIDILPPTVELDKNLHLIPGRLSIHRFENKIAERWSGAYQGDNLAIRTITRIRELCNLYNEKYDYKYIIIDTSPSLGILNKTIISTVDGFFIPAQPDMFSLYGIRNIGNSLDNWQTEFKTIYSLISQDKRNKFPKEFVQFLGFTIYNAKKYANDNNDFDLAQAHYSYVKKIPETIKEFIKENNRKHLTEEMLQNPIGMDAVIHSHNTFPSVSQALKCPMWRVPEFYSAMKKATPKLLEEKGIEPINHGSYGKFRETKDKYIAFTNSLLQRVNTF
jgi:cellulose biosynthesis protein BcsQ